MPISDLLRKRPFARKDEEKDERVLEKDTASSIQLAEELWDQIQQDSGFSGQAAVDASKLNEELLSAPRNVITTKPAGAPPDPWFPGRLRHYRYVIVDVVSILRPVPTTQRLRQPDH